MECNILWKILLPKYVDLKNEKDINGPIVFDSFWGTRYWALFLI